MTRNQYKTLLNGRTEAMWTRYKDAGTLELLTALRRNQQAGRHLTAGDLAAIRASLERGQTVRDLSKPGLRKILDDRFEYVAYQTQGGA